MVGAGATRSAIRITLSDREESVSAVLDGFSTQSFTAIQFSRPQAPCLSAEPTETNLRWRLKRPPFGGPGKRSQSVGRSNLSAALSCQVVPLHQLEKYSTASPGVKPQMRIFGRYPLPLTRAPNRPFGRLGSSTEAIIAPPERASRDASEKIQSARPATAMRA